MNIKEPKVRNSGKSGGRILATNENRPVKSGHVTRKSKNGGFRTIAAREMDRAMLTSSMRRGSKAPCLFATMETRF